MQTLAELAATLPAECFEPNPHPLGALTYEDYLHELNDCPFRGTCFEQTFEEWAAMHRADGAEVII